MADGDQASKNQGGGDATVKANTTFKPRRLEGQRDRMARRAAGKRSRTKVSRKSGRYVSSRPAKRVTDLALDATLREAAIYQRERRAETSGEQSAPSRRVILRRTDLRQKVRVRKTRNAVCFVVDASWSMAAEERMRATKAAVLSLLRDAYQRRDQVGLVSFQRDYATLLLPLTNSIELAQKQLQTMPTGGKTPLSRGVLGCAGELRRMNDADVRTIAEALPPVPRKVFERLAEALKRRAGEPADKVILDTMAQLWRLELHQPIELSLWDISRGRR